MASDNIAVSSLPFILFMHNLPIIFLRSVTISLISCDSYGFYSIYLTVTLTFLDTPLWANTVIVHVPLPLAVILPFFETVATLLSDVR